MTPAHRVIARRRPWLPSSVAALVVGVAAVQTDRPAPLPAGVDRAACGPAAALARARRARRPRRRAISGAARSSTREASVAGASGSFARHDSLEARVGRAVRRLARRTVDRLDQLAGLHPTSAVVQLHLGLGAVLGAAGGSRGCLACCRRGRAGHAVRRRGRQPALPAVRARTCRVFVPSASLPARSGRAHARRAARRAGAARARRRQARRRLFYGVALQRLGHQLSAERGCSARARAGARPTPRRRSRPPSARFDKARPAAAFSRLGPLTRRFPQAATVRFHLGLLLLWSGQVKEAQRQLGLARHGRARITARRARRSATSSALDRAGI